MTPLRVGLIALAATILGLVNLHSAATGPSGHLGPQLRAQIVHAVLGIGAFGVAARIPPGRLRDHARSAWVAVVAMLVAVLVFGHVAGGARSWLALGPVRIQPAELMKIVLPLALAAEACRPLALRKWRHWGFIGGIVLVPLGLLAAQPDLGAVGLLGLGAASLLWISGVPRWTLVATGLVGVVSAPVGWGMLHDYQKARVLTFLDPTRDPDGAGYQTLQSLYAFAGGGITGVGHGAGTQGRLGFLPEHETDFILAFLAEEWGLIGGLLALGVLFGLVVAGLSIAERARDRFSALFAAGLSLQLLWQVLVNAGGVLGLLPLTGVTLPFFSYGGSSMLVMWASAGLLASLSRRPARGLAPGQVRFGPNTEVPDMDAILQR